MDLANRLRNPRLFGRLGEEGIATLARKEVAVVGVGSYGSRVATELGAMGVGRMTLVDPDQVTPDIVFRFAVGKSWVGKPKVEAIKWAIREKSDCEVTALVADVRDQPQSLAAADLVIIAGLGSEPTEVQVGHLAADLGKSVMSGGVYRKARGGEITLVKPDNGPCPTCISSWMSRDYPSADLPPAYGVSQITAEPGIGAEIGIISNITAVAALRALTDQPAFDWSEPGDSEYNGLVFASHPIKVRGNQGESEELGPLANWLMRYPKYPGCRECFPGSEEQKPLSQIISGWKAGEAE